MACASELESVAEWVSFVDHPVTEAAEEGVALNFGDDRWLLSDPSFLQDSALEDGSDNRFVYQGLAGLEQSSCVQLRDTAGGARPGGRAVEFPVREDAGVGLCR